MAITETLVDHYETGASNLVLGRCKKPAIQLAKVPHEALVIRIIPAKAVMP